MDATETRIFLIRAAATEWRHVNLGFLSAVAVLIALLASGSGYAQSSPDRQPFGIYARYVPGGCINHPGAGTNTDECVSNSIADILSNPGIAGIAEFVQWDEVSQPFPLGQTNSTSGTNIWGVVDDVFGEVAQWNADNSNCPPKTIQLGFIPGFDTPQWVLNQLTNCDPMFLANNTVNTNLVTNTCGCATFLSGEGPNVVYTNKLLPLPWNPIYSNNFKAFIQAAAQRYNTNPLLVTVEIAGPTSDSTEMILPNGKNNLTNYWKWNPLLSLTFPTNYQNSDRAFIEAWEAAIDMYGAAFTNTTLAMTTGSGFPNFFYTNSSGDVVPYPNYTVPPGFNWPPGSVNTNDQDRLMDAAAETTILAYFADPRHGGNNAKACQEDGLTAGAASELQNHDLSGGGDLDSYSVKWLAQSSASGFAPLPGTTNVISRVLGGLQFTTSFSGDPLDEGCNDSDNCTNGAPSPEQAFYNVMQVYFDGTAAGGVYNVTNGNLRLNYLQIYSSDVVYANTNTTGSDVMTGSGVILANLTATSEFTNAAWQIFNIGEAVLNIQPGAKNLQLTWPEAAYPYHLQVENDLSVADGWKTNANTASPTLTNGFYQVPIISPAPVRFYRLALP
jgi:hypothetical protein